MSALSRIRQNMGLIVIVIFVALAAFILTDFFQGISTTLAGPMDAGTVAGESVSFQDYQSTVSQQLQGSGISGDELQSGRLRDQVWNQMVSDIVMDNEFEKAGMKISSQEVYDMFAGDDISPLVRNYILPPGQPYDQTQMKAMLSQIINTPGQAEQLKQLEDYAVRARGMERYLNMVKAGFVGSDAYTKAKHVEQNRRVNLSFLSVPYAQIPDEEVEVSDRDLQSYLSSHQETYKQEAQTFVRYARFQLKASKPDSTLAMATISKLKNEFAKSTNDSTFTSIRSRTPYTQTYLPAYQLPPSIRESIIGAAPKTVVGPILENGAYVLYKLVDTEKAVEPAVSIRHILVQFSADTNAVRAEAASLARQARGGADFATLASENSDDFSSKDRGGELGWYQKGQFGDDFEKAVQAAGKGSIIGPVKGRGGFHVVEILDKSTLNYDIAKIEEGISFSSSTRDSVYGKANYFAASLIASKDINESGSESNVVVLESSPLTQETRDVLGLNGGRELVIWAVNSDLGDISKVLRINDNYVVAQVTQKKSEGLQNLEDVRDAVKAKVLNEKKADLIMKKLKGLAGQDLNAMKDGYGAGASVSTASNISFSSNTIPGIGTDKFIIGKALGMQQGQTSQPIAGDNGVYILQVTGITEAPELDATMLGTSKSREASSGQLGIQSKVIPALIDIADVTDNRAKVEARNFGYR